MGLTFRGEKGRPLSFYELDENFRSLYKNARVWDDSIQYELDDIVIFGGDIYSVIQVPPVATLPTEPNYWLSLLDSNYINASGDTMNGDLTIFNGNLIIQKASGETVFTINSIDGTTKQTTVSLTNVVETSNVLNIDTNTCNALYLDIIVHETVTNAYRTDIITIIQDGISLKYNIMCTPDLNNSTDGIEFTASIIDTNIVLVAEITSGIWDITIGARKM